MELPGTNSGVNLEWDGISINGNLTIENTGSGLLSLCSPTIGNGATVTIVGDLIQSGGTLTANISEETGTTVTVNHSGNINITGGEFSISKGSQGGTGTTIWNLSNGNFSITNAVTHNSTTTPLGARFVFGRAGTQSLTLGSGNTIYELPIEVKNGTTLNMGTNILTGNGSFVLDTGATLQKLHMQAGSDGSIQIGGTKLLSTAANYSFNGSSVQVTGTSLPDTVNNMVLNNSSGLTLSNSVVVNGTLNMQLGGLSGGGNVLTYGVNGTLMYSGTTVQTTTDTEFPLTGGPKNLEIANTINPVTLHANRTVTGRLHLSAK